MQTTLWIIDGFNLIRSDGRLSGEEHTRGTAVAKTLLESQLGVFLAGQPRGTAVALCYDGAAPRGGSGARGSVRILYPSAGKTADDLVLAEARAAEGRGARIYVVTSDLRDIGRRLTGLKVTRVDSRAFAERLWRAGGERAADAEKPRAESKREQQSWLERFQGGPPHE